MTQDIHKDMNITYGELNKVMKSLGFQSRVEKSNDELKERLLGHPRYFIMYYDEKGELFYPVLVRPDDTPVPLYNLYHIARQLRDFGYTEEFESLAKMVEENRLVGQEAVAA